MLIGGVALAAWFAAIGFDPQWRRWWLQYLVVGVLTSGFPFLLFAYAAVTLPASLLSVLNATSPMWGAVMAAVLLGERLTARRVVGFALGIAGVALVTRPEPGTSLAVLPIAAALAAPVCYGIAGPYLKRWASAAPARGMALGTQLTTGVALLPLNAIWPPTTPSPSLLIVASILTLGLVCGAVAYLLYFRLINDIGPTGALTVTYLVPIFGVTWGVIFLGETVSHGMLAGGALVIAGTVLVLRN
jgi:drug/metabolite transporter (DMT)-like permease